MSKRALDLLRLSVLRGGVPVLLVDGRSYDELEGLRFARQEGNNSAGNVVPTSLGVLRALVEGWIIKHPGDERSMTDRLAER